MHGDIIKNRNRILFDVKKIVVIVNKGFLGISLVCASSEITDCYVDVKLSSLFN